MMVNYVLGEKLCISIATNSKTKFNNISLQRIVVYDAFYQVAH